MAWSPEGSGLVDPLPLDGPRSRAAFSRRGARRCALCDVCPLERNLVKLRRDEKVDGIRRV